ncbi:hypothetical protein [Pedobacter immunditicola]|uniref:hypothetical protein n=1 Tax=Pedobacter immunditicola TaxID=3133440 RepID=UPI0030AE2872
MTNGPVLLLNWVEDTIHPKKLTHSPLTSTHVLSLQEDLATEVKMFRKTLFKQLIFSKKEASASIKQLVKISDTIHHYLFRMAPAWSRSVSASQIRSLYIYTLNFLETMLEDLARLAPKIYTQTPVTQYSLPNLMMELKGSYKIFLLHLDQLAVDGDLKILVQQGVCQLICKKEISPLNADYCRHLMAVVNGTVYADTRMFKELLLMCGFNLPEFYLYCISDFKNSLENISGLHEQLGMLMTEQDKLNSLPVNKKVKMLPGVVPIDEQLQGFLSEKKKYIKQMLKLRRVILQDDQLTKSMMRLRINMPVAQFGLLIRLHIEKGLLLKENIGEVFNFFAAHFYTPQTMFISSESLRKKSTDVEFSTAQKLKAHLIAMLNWLNENYNLSNYKGS